MNVTETINPPLESGILGGPVMLSLNHKERHCTPNLYARYSVGGAGHAGVMGS